MPPKDFPTTTIIGTLGKDFSGNVRFRNPFK
jgi:hypothetical protein